jgi:GNAT superfamily N-acetyltransferase
MRIERATPADFGLVVRLVERLLEELSDSDDGDEFSGLDRARTLTHLEAERDRFAALIARESNGEPAGVLTLTETFAIYAGGAYGVIDELYVVPAHRSAGVGRLLLDEAVAIGRERGWRRLDVTAPPGDAWRRTVAFYEKNGFVFTGPKLRRSLAPGI